MRRRSLLRGLLGIAVLVLALCAALLSRGVADAAQEFQSEQAHWQAGVVAKPSPPAGMFERLGGELLGIRVRSRILDAYVNYRFTLSYATSSTLFLQTQARSDATLAITKLLPSLTKAGDRSKAEVTLGVLYALSAFASGSSQRPTLMANAIASLRHAVRADPTNAVAKYDLEFLLSPPARTTAQQQQQQSSGNQAHGKNRKKGKRGRRLGVTPQGQLEGSGY